jgi:hypothetical protein
MDPRGVGPVTIELNNTAAQLLARLCIELDTEDVTGVMSRALGLLDLGVRTKRQGGPWDADRSTASRTSYGLRTSKSISARTSSAAVDHRSS